MEPPEEASGWQFLRQHNLHQVGGYNLSPFQMEGHPFAFTARKGTDYFFRYAPNFS